MTHADSPPSSRLPATPYGTFLEAEGCFELNREPPRKWWNLQCSAINPEGDELYAEVAHINDGCTWVRDRNGVTVRLVGYDRKYHYLRDEESGTVFCPAGDPVPTPVQDRTIRFYREKTVMASTCDGLRATQRVFVPQTVPLECTTVTVENLTDRPRTVSVFSYAGFDLSGCDAEGRPTGCEAYTEIHPDLGGVVCINRHPGLPTDRFGAFLIALQPLAGANGYRDHFTRAAYSLGATRILDGWNCDGRPGYGPDCAGILQVRLHLPPRGSGRADVVLGQTRGPDDVRALRASLSPDQLDAWCDEAARVEAERASRFTIAIGMPAYEGLFNVFLKKQLATYLINKSGFRDNLQTDIALALADPEAAEANLVRALASQKPDGSVLHGFRPLNRLHYSDKPAWILHALPALLKETGRFNLLETVVPYFESREEGTVWDHAVRAMRHLCTDLGRHGLCRQHHADWNDGLEATPEAGERESVFVTLQLAYGLREMAELARQTGAPDIAAEADEQYRIVKDRINEVCWDGAWYTRTHCEDGTVIGSHRNEAGQLYLNPQSWAVLSGVAEGDRAHAIMAKVDEVLETDIGYRICHPPYSAYDPRVGRMSNAMPGANENGGCYNHAAGFKGVADCLLGRREAAWRTFTRVTPGSPLNPLSRSGAEPFSYVNSYSCVPQIYGQSGYAWRTGTAGWMTQLLIEYILGVRRGYDGLVLAPCLPDAIPEARLVRTFRGARYHVRITRRPDGDGAAPVTASLNGSPLSTPIVPPQPKGDHTVEVLA